MRYGGSQSGTVLDSSFALYICFVETVTPSSTSNATLSAKKGFISLTLNFGT